MLVRIASYGPQIDQSHGENRLSHIMMEVIDWGNCNSVEGLARCWHSLLLPELQRLVSTSQGTKIGQELRLFCNAATSLW